MFFSQTGFFFVCCPFWLLCLFAYNQNRPFKENKENACFNACLIKISPLDHECTFGENSPNYDHSWSLSPNLGYKEQKVKWIFDPTLTPPFIVALWDLLRNWVLFGHEIIQGLPRPCSYSEVVQKIVTLGWTWHYLFSLPQEMDHNLWAVGLPPVLPHPGLIVVERVQDLKPHVASLRASVCNFCLIKGMKFDYTWISSWTLQLSLCLFLLLTWYTSSEKKLQSGYAIHFFVCYIHCGILLTLRKGIRHSKMTLKITLLFCSRFD